jgi:hypothetical protein
MKAFPEVNYVKPLGNGQSVMTLSGGMDLRDYFAGQVIIGFLANPKTDYSSNLIAGLAYAMADEMMKVRVA